MIPVVGIVLDERRRGGEPSTTTNNYYEAPESRASGQAAPVSNTCPEQRSRTSNDVTVDLFVAIKDGQACWAREVSPKEAPARLQFEIRYENSSDVLQRRRGLCRTTAWADRRPRRDPPLQQQQRRRCPVQVGLVSGGGIVIGNYNPGAVAYVLVDVTSTFVESLDCGKNRLTTTATAQPQNLNYFYNTADVNLTRRDC